VLGQFISVDPDLADTLEPYSYAGGNPVSDTDPNGLYKAIVYKPACSAIGCINIIKRCQDNLKNCGLYWNTELRVPFKLMTNIDIIYTIYVSGKLAYGPKEYGHLKHGSSVSLFHGSWGFTNGNNWGQYTYGCDVLFECTGYLKSSDEVSMDGAGTGYLAGRLYNVGFFGSWKENSGKEQAWAGVFRWAGLPPG
jgi:hypothetical protein